MTTLGWIGLGNIGHVMAGHIVPTTGKLIVADPINGEKAPKHAKIATNNQEVARHAESVFLSLPSGEISKTVCRELIDEPNSIVRRIVDTSTVGIAYAEDIAEMLADKGVDYIDSPVSGGVRGARDASLAIIVSASDDAVASVVPYLEMMGKVLVVGNKPGQAQALKLLNNFLAGTALVATSEAFAFGVACGLDMEKIIEVVNMASGRNTATMFKFPEQILPGKYEGGFATELFAKDLGLYTESVKSINMPDVLGVAVAKLWSNMEHDFPKSDSTRVYPYIKNRNKDAS